MIRLTLTDKTGESQTHFFEGTSLTIGRLRHNDIVLPKTNVSKRHVKIVWKNQQFTVIDLRSTNGTFLNGERITAPITVGVDDVVNVGDYAINVALEQNPESFDDPAPPSPPMDTNTPQVLDALSSDSESLPQASAEDFDYDDPFAEFIPPTTNMAAEELNSKNEKKKAPDKGVGSTMALGSLSEEEREAVSAALIPSDSSTSKNEESPAEPEQEQPPEPPDEEATKANFKETKGLDGVAIGPDFRDPAADDELEIDPERIASEFDGAEDARNRIFTEAQAATEQSRALLIAARIAGDTDQRDEYARRIGERVATVLHAFEEAGVLSDDMDKDELQKDFHTAMLGLGPIDALLDDEKIGEIRIYGHDKVFIEAKGKWVESETNFLGEQGFALATRSLSAFSDCDMDDPDIMVTGGLDGRARFCVIADPLATSTPTVVINRTTYSTASSTESLADLVKKNILSPKVASAIDNAIQEKRGIMIVGPASTYRTRIFSAIASEIPSNETACIFTETGVSPDMKCPTTQLDRRLLQTGENIVNEILSNLQPTHVLAPDIQYHELCSKGGLLAAMSESGALRACTIAADGQDFLRRVENSLSTGFPGMAHDDRVRLIHDIISVLVETPSNSTPSKKLNFSASNIEIEGGDLRLSSIKS